MVVRDGVADVNGMCNISSKAIRPPAPHAVHYEKFTRNVEPLGIQQRRCDHPWQSRQLVDIVVQCSDSEKMSATKSGHADR